jgi:diaminohydroxyphosphoribosylaminopyrimidine deaminase/5-amino-6-(5-phosphoribosylamino)uracil reductase
MQQIRSDEEGMRAALAWSARGRGKTSPRPSVGCVLVKDGYVIGGGHTQPGNGNPHAEVMALRDAREAGHDIGGATAYVTLEPCSHYATTPPCSDALIAAGIARAVCGVRDPNPEVNGRGYNLLREAGIEVVENFLEDECARAQDHFLVHILLRRPFVTLKNAVSLDGKSATSTGESQWITGEAARRRVHEMRADHAAVLAGVDTLLADDALLNVRLPDYEGRQPARIILDSRGRLAQHSHRLRILNERSEGGAVFVATTSAITTENRKILEDKGVHLLTVEAKAGRVSISPLLVQLYEHDICSVLVEGGAQVASSFLSAGVVDKVECFIAPLVIGGDGRNAVEGYGVNHLADAIRLQGVRLERIENDIHVSGYNRLLPGTAAYRAALEAELAALQEKLGEE